MKFQSILYEEAEYAVRIRPSQAPEYFRDLNLDQVIDAITAGRDECDLKPFFHDKLKTTRAVQYRHEVMRDLENEDIRECMGSFAKTMRLMRQKITLTNKLYYKHQKQRWFLHAVEIYCTAVDFLQEELTRLKPSSRGLLAFRDEVTRYAESSPFVSLAATARALAGDLAAIRYSVLIKGNGFKVRKYDAEQDYSEEVADTFKKFRQGEVKDYRASFHESFEINQIEAQVLEFVARLYPQEFSRLDGFFTRNQDYADALLTKFDREIQFYVAYLEYMTRFTKEGLNFCYPAVSPAGKDVRDEETFDLALATKLTAAKTPVVCNDLGLTGKERIFVVSGPNQGGKTTFARTFGQLHHLASIGCPVPGRNARLFLCDSIFTHFEREETIEDRNGKLQDDLLRIHDILEKATPRSIIIINEIFNSTALEDAVFLARKVIGRIIELDCLCVFVTFLDEMASLSETTVSMVSSVVPNNPAMRTFKVVRRPADGLSHAISIAEKYQLTYECLKMRLPS